MSMTSVTPQITSNSKLDNGVKNRCMVLKLTRRFASLYCLGNDNNWKLSHLTAYQLFPLLGIVAFSIMWSHYVSGTVRELLGANKKALANYFRYTGYAVLLLICFHPGLLILQRFRDGYGLPPSSYESYVAPGLGWVTLLGTVSFFVFIAFEFRRIFGNRSWWHFVTEAGDFAMLAILYHGLRLGGQLMHAGWYRTVWAFYAIILVAILGRSYYNKYFLQPAKTT